MEYITTGVQFIFIEIIISGRKILFGVVYNPQANFDNRSNLQPVFSDILHHYNDIIITGDFNTNILSDSGRTVDFIDLLEEYNLTNYSYSPTHFLNDNRNIETTCLDLLITNRSSGILSFTQIDVPGFSKHDLIFFVYDVVIDPPPPKTIIFRDYSNVNLEDISEFMTSRASNLYVMHDSGDLVRGLTSLVSDSFERFVPLKVVHLNTQQNSWFSSEIQSGINRRNEAYRIWTRTRTPESKQSYIYLRNLIKAQITLAKRRFLNKYFENKLDSKELWKRIRNLGIHSKDECTIPFTSNDMNRNFVSSSSLLHSFSSLPSYTSDPQNRNVDLALAPSFSFRNVSMIEVHTAILSVKSNAIGCDGIALKYIKMILPTILHLITHIFNYILTSSIFPVDWKVAKITPIPKTSNPKTLNDIRPISILSGLSKAFEKLVKEQINTHIQENNLLTIKQSGFRKAHSTETTLLVVSDDIINMLDEKKIAVLVLLDFSKAFDMVDHGILLDKLIDKFNFSRSATSLLRTYLTDRKQYVQYDNMSSDTLLLSSGVPQGSILGPLLFSMFINDLPTVLQHCNCRMFADDVQIYCGEKSFNTARLAANLNKDLENIAKWAERNRLLLNPEKCQGIIFSLSSNDLHRDSLPPIKLSNRTINITTKVKNLGLIMDCSLSWKEHINIVCGKIYGGLRSLWSSCSSTTLKLRKKLVNSLLLPHFTYCLSVLGCLNITVFCKLQRAYNACLRYVYNLGRYTSVTQYSIDFMGCSLKSFLKYRICLFLFKIISSGDPIEIFSRITPGRSNRLGHLRVPRNRTVVKNKSFFVYAVSLYNSIPLNIRILPLSQFKAKSFTFFSSMSN